MAKQKKASPKQETKAKVFISTPVTIEPYPHDETGYFKLLSESPKDMGNVYQYLTTSSAALGGTISTINNGLEKIEDMVTKQQQTDTQSQINKSLQPLHRELDKIKQALIPLRQTKDTINKVEGFLKENTALLIGSIESQGKIRALESELTSIAKRIDRIEDNKKTIWNNTVAVITIILTFIFSIAGLAVSIFKK